MLQVFTVVAFGLAAALLVWPPNTTVAPIAPTLPALAAAAPEIPSSSTALTDSIVDGNIFSLTREAPVARTFAAAPVDPTDVGPASGVTSADGGVGESLASSDADPVPSLYGVVNGPLGPAALLRLDNARRGSRLFHLGEGSGGYKVRSIGKDNVELDGPSGAVVLTLTSHGVTP